jgi:hypothetical protein
VVILNRSKTIKLFPEMTKKTILISLIGLSYASFGDEPAMKNIGGLDKQDTAAYLVQIIEDSQKHAYQRKSPADHPLRKAELCADGLGGDLETLGEAQLGIVEGWVKEKQWEDAAWLVEKMIGAGRPKAHAFLALEMVRAGKKEEAAEQLRLAEGNLYQAKGEKAEQVRSLFAVVKSLMGETAEVERLIGQLGEAEKLELECRFLDLDLGNVWTLKQAEDRLAGVDENVKTNRLSAQFLCACAARQIRAGNLEEGMLLANAAGKLATAKGSPSEQRILVSVAKAAWAAGDFHSARKAMNVFLACVEQWSDEADWKVPFLCEALDVLLDWKDKETVTAWLEAAKQLLPKVFVLYNAKSAMAVAKIVERVDGPEEGDKLALQAAKAGMVHPHERGRATTGVIICMHYANAGRPVPADVWKVVYPHPQEEER